MNRSENMRRIKSTGMGPEMRVRKLLHALGYRYRLHRYDLPGRPDIVFPRRRKIIFVHGCFWHQHTCRDGRKPKSNSDYWKPKLARNVARDKAHKAELTKSGWEVLTVWECETKTLETLQPRLQRFLGDARVK